MEHYELINYTFQLECKLFKTTDSYRLIEQKCSTKCFSPAEKQQLEEDIHYVFTRLIKIITQACPDLTREDIIFCCLMKLGLQSDDIARCMGSFSKQAINQRKYRIRKKIQETKCSFLHNIMFG